MFSMFMTRLSHLVLYVVGKVADQVSGHEDYCKAYIHHFPCFCCGLMKNTPRLTYCVFPVHTLLSDGEQYPRAYVLCFPCSYCGVMKNTARPVSCVFPVHVVE